MPRINTNVHESDSAGHFPIQVEVTAASIRLALKLSMAIALIRAHSCKFMAN